MKRKDDILISGLDPADDTPGVQNGAVVVGGRLRVLGCPREKARKAEWRGKSSQIVCDGFPRRSHSAADAFAIQEMPGAGKRPEGPDGFLYGMSGRHFREHVRVPTVREQARRRAWTV